MFESVRSRTVQTVVDRVCQCADVPRMTRMFGRVQAVRSRVQDVQEALLHSANLPARSDVRRLRKKVLKLRCQVRALEDEVAELEKLTSSVGPAK